jgi:hypothetical protein
MNENWKINEDREELEAEEVEEKEEKGGRKILQTVGGVLLVLAIGAAIYYFLIYKKGERAPQAAESQAVVAKEKEISPAEQGGVSPGPLVELDKSDDLVRQLAKEVSSHPRFPVWLQSDHLIRRFVASVDNIANGLSPRPHIDFFMPPGEFKVIKNGSLYYADPDGYGRYNPVVDVIVSLDSKQCAYLFRTLKPLFQEAYRDLGYPGEDFQDTFIRAIIELLKAPVVDGDVVLEKTVVSYVMVDRELENLSEAQKHLLRMGPGNVGAIQAKLREIALELGIEESRLPKPRFYVPRPSGN